MTQAKKRFGQHFLSNQGVIQKIIYSIKHFYDEDHWILEIGPGQGALTRVLLKEGFKVLAVDIDRDCVEILQKKFAQEIEEERFKIVQADILNCHFQSIIEQKIKIAVGNLPYNVGSQIVFKFMEECLDVKHMAFMLQKEVVLRFCASSIGQRKHYGIPALCFQYLFDYCDHFWIQRGSFNPPPKVESGFFTATRKELVKIDKQYFNFKKVIKSAFSQRRKMMRGYYQYSLPDAMSAKRAEELTFDDFISLSQML